MIILSGFQAGTSFKHFEQVFIGGAGVGGGFEDDQLGLRIEGGIGRHLTLTLSPIEAERGCGNGISDFRFIPAQIGGDGTAGFDDVGNIGFAVFVQGGGDADDDGFDFAHAGKVSGGGETAGLHKGGNSCPLDVLDIAVPSGDGVYFGRVNVQTDDRDTGAGELE